MKDMALWNEGDWIAAIAAMFLFAFLAIGAAIASRNSETVAGHPRGLFVLFYAEMWERFSYYGMRALLVLYLTKHWLYSDSESNLIYGAYGALVYITPVLGGLIADRYLGQRKAVIFGGVLLAIGHGLMAVEGGGGQSDPVINVFWSALAFIIVGSGFLKANISVIVGQLYKMSDIRRDAAYTIFYMGVNVGAALGTILVGYLGETIGWSYGFGLAGIGMVIGLFIFVIGKPALQGRGEAPTKLTQSREWSFYAIGIGAVAVIWMLIQYTAVIQNLLIVTGLAMLGYTLYEAFKLPKEPRERIFAMLFLIALNPLFWGLFEQAGGSLNLYTDKFVDKGGGADQPVPVDQPDLYRVVRAVLRSAVAISWPQRTRTIRPGQVRDRTYAGWPWLSAVRVGCQFGWRGGADTGVVRVPDLPAAHYRRIVSLAGGPLGNGAASPAAPRQLCDGRVVLYDRGGQFRRRENR